MKKIAKFFLNIKKEMEKVKWPNKKEMITYSTATLVILLIFALFFMGTDLILAGLKILVK